MNQQMQYAIMVLETHLAHKKTELSIRDTRTRYSESNSQAKREIKQKIEDLTRALAIIRE